MLAYRKRRPSPGLSLDDCPAPGAPEAGEVTVRVEAVGICGSDLHVADWSGGYDFMLPHLPLTLGHEFAGIIEATGPGVARVTPGDRVTIWPSSPCDTCPECTAGRRRNCRNKATLGLYRDGAFAPLVTARAQGAFTIPDALSFEIAALTEPLCVGRRAVKTGEVSPGDRVLVLGPGTIGQSIAVFARAAGAAQIGIAGMNDPARLEVCNRLGFDQTYDLSDPGARTRMQADFDEADVVFEATGRDESVQDGLGLLRMEGILVMTGIHSGDVSFDATSFVRGRRQIRASHGSGEEDWHAVIATLADPALDLAPMITHRLPLSRIAEGLSLASSRRASKVMIFPQQQDVSE
ncbi:threonine 3-dehydrogenase [Pseudooceanicola batsensis HTCC2597]|uniref:Threonine 3-dehydrogenase n=1 Tax=Pseudooceanicola batsensis (strain ATCC BAA-863 / DSM 15984 / KCTC 12145 / HTCC2597) TaxID=252305 RepID=A3U1C0_PSEBH|nr:alcohol dehydrogenase catalytic domain-containing protein [Pseudooceanicola batsensis]EAQ02103.1 threonine 3-dehydrogenase [Pseudooceanicola batsensis HTCC2597]